VDEARRALEITERMHALAASPAGALLTLAELERQAEEEVALARERLARTRDREPR
jgi:hypothetical protein